ncbi:MAG TPA: hypothetical protein VM580_15880 [Labilithrix sp.]|nr:hypothetical protein [Labilithrix sp.]
MKTALVVVAAAALFAFAPFASRFSPLASSLILVWLSVLLAMLASGTLSSHGTPLAVGTGALGAFAGGLLASVSPIIAGGVLVAAAYAERTTRVRANAAAAMHVLVALIGGALAGALSNAYASAPLSVFAVAMLVAGVLSALPLLIDADDAVAHTLEQASALVAEPAKRSLLDGAELRRNAADVPLDRATSGRVTTTWQSLLRLADARVRLERTRPQALLRLAERVAMAPANQAAASEAAPASSKAPSAADAVLSMVDQRIAEHVTVLARAYTAVDTVSAARIGLDDTALKNVESIGESLDEVSRAIVEVRTEDRAPDTTA